MTLPVFGNEIEQINLQNFNYFYNSKIKTTARDNYPPFCLYQVARLSDQELMEITPNIHSREASIALIVMKLLKKDKTIKEITLSSDDKKITYHDKETNLEFTLYNIKEGVK
jgi:hypothetical protein